MKKIIYILFLLGVYSYASCEYKEEVKPANLNKIVKVVVDYAGKASQTFTVHAKSFSSASWCTDQDLYTTIIPDGTKAKISLKADDSRCGFQTRDLGSIDFGVPIKRIKRIKFKSTTSGTGCNTVKNDLDVYNSSSSDSLYVGNLSYCPGYSAQSPSVSFDVDTIEVETDAICPSGYVADGTKCKKQEQYNYYKYSCNSNDKNTQGYGWKLTIPQSNDGGKIDPDTNNINNLSGAVYSHSTAPQCKRKYQQCTINCQAPLVFDSVSKKCVATYSKVCKSKGEVYNSTTHKCQINNQCFYASAVKNNKNDFCKMPPNCDFKNGVCSEIVNKTCALPQSFSYNAINDACLKNTACLNNEFVSSDGSDKCVGTPFCNQGDINKPTKCESNKIIEKSCSPDNRSGNVCFQGGKSDTSITYKHPLVKTTFSGGFKADSFKDMLNIDCSAKGTKCQYRLTDMYAYTGENSQNHLCFKSAYGRESCIDVIGQCKFSGKIHSEDGIKQLRIINGKTIAGYDLEDSNNSVGEITSTCFLSGKVGNFKGSSVSKDIIAVKANGENLEFWDPYRRGFIGVISSLPTISDDDIANGFGYQDQEVYNLIKKGFTAFYSPDAQSDTYAVYDGLISRAKCLDLIKGTSFFVSQPATNTDVLMYRGLNFKSSDNYNYNDGDTINGSCVIQSKKHLAFNQQKFSQKVTSVQDTNTVFVCSPYKCNQGTCQYNQCEQGYSGDVYEQSYFDEIIAKSYPNIGTQIPCTDEVCDSNKPYFGYCGNKTKCQIAPDVFQQNDGSCVKITCKQNEVLDVKTAKCISYGCKNSIEKDGKCYKSLLQ